MIDPQDALDAIGLLPDVEIDISGAALQLARLDAPDAKWNTARLHLSELARDTVELANHLPDGGPAARANALAGLIVEGHGYAGDTETYDDLANANLIRVIERRKGLPVALGILWLHCARAAGWNAHGVNFPGHFLIAIEGKGGRVVVDVFAGGKTMQARDLRALLKVIEGPDAELRPGLLAPMNTRDVLLRLQQNIKMRYLQAGRLKEALACTENMLRVAPDHSTLWREAAAMNQRLGHVGDALRCFERFIELVPQGEAATRARAVIDELRTRLN
jgi:regulator of sirC expression with transglutaminase-like and TPR domain